MVARAQIRRCVWFSTQPGLWFPFLSQTQKTQPYVKADMGLRLDNTTSAFQSMDQPSAVETKAGGVLESAPAVFGYEDFVQKP